MKKSSAAIFGSALLAAAGAGSFIAFVPVAGGDPPASSTPTTYAAGLPSGAIAATPTTTVPPTGPTASAPVAGANARMQEAPSITLTHTQGPRVAESNTRCSSASVRASLISLGPYNNQQAIQLIIGLTSSKSCYVEGYPTLAFMGRSGANRGVSVIRGGTTGTSGAVEKVTLGMRSPASFMIQVSSIGCSPVHQFNIGLPGSSAEIPVALRPILIGSWTACRTVNMTPVEQGTSITRYAF